ncbi:hypothetical protein IW140_003184 [Coemansia sp. RSA 1813]|nr:hypothetical protein EV178_003134 [Coemansia sp. RSA 1646]KAJ1773943.1 hypothetical protein LPJ74_000040 [Coemansia sp. RSA 1843]KAJ2089338.1 hypothetical protein IW138_003506 [Coemansia sp. RSA 986]KAJ2569339.1 hypothetical protein IW140_003184 [Coemansia sp. RSA 1813]
MLSIIGVVADATSSGGMPATPSVSVAVPFDHLAQNLPDALSALENQFQDADFKSVLTSQLNNPNAVEMFQSLIHDQGAVNSISALLEDPNIQSSLSAQFVQQYLLPAETTGMRSDNAHNAEDTDDVTGHTGSLDIENSLDELKHHSSTHNGASSRPRTLVLGCLLTFLLSALAPM